MAQGNSQLISPLLSMCLSCGDDVCVYAYDSLCKLDPSTSNNMVHYKYTNLEKRLKKYQRTLVNLLKQVKYD